MMPSTHLTVTLWESVPIPAMAQGSSIWEHGGLGAGRFPSSCLGLERSEEQLSG